LSLRQWPWACWASLKTMAKVAAREPHPLVHTVRRRTVAKVDSIGSTGFVFHYPVRFTCELFTSHNFRSYLDGAVLGKNVRKMLDVVAAFQGHSL
jgi:hypothetical protein